MIAKEANVSITCASNILNGKSSEYTEKTITRVQEIAKRLNYIPNSIARSMKTNSTMTLGLIMPDISNPYYPELTKAIEETAYELGYNIITINTNYNKKKEESAFKVLYERMVNGIIYIPSFIVSDFKKTDIENSRIPIVMVDRANKMKGISGYVSTDDFNGALKATQYLIDRDKKNILFISGEKQSIEISERIIGYKEALNLNKLLVNEDYIKEGDYTVETGYEITKEFIKNHKCDAIFAASDFIAIGALKAIVESNLRVPEDISLIGYDDIYFSKYCNPELTTVAQPKYKMGVEAVRMLVDFINQKQVKKTSIILQNKLVIRKSVN